MQKIKVAPSTETRWRRSCVPSWRMYAGYRRWPPPLRSDVRAWSRDHNQFGDCCFATAGPTLWNSLPEQLRHRTSPSDNSNDRWKRLFG